MQHFLQTQVHLAVPTRNHTQWTSNKAEPDTGTWNNIHYELSKVPTRKSKTVSMTPDTAVNDTAPAGHTKVGDRNIKARVTVQSATSYHNSQRDVTKECLPTLDTSNFKTPFKIYVYDIPPYFNDDIQRTMSDEKKYSYCYDLDYCGMGAELFQLENNTYETSENFSKETGRKQNKSIQSVRNTHQFSLETILHYKMLNSPYRTSDPEKADIFYIPAYTGLNCLKFLDNAAEFINDLFNYLHTNQSKYFLGGKPQIMTLSKIQREQGSENCPTLMHKDSHNITFIGIEKESNPFWAQYVKIHGESLVVAPYPSYVHFIPNINDKTLYEFNGGLMSLEETRFFLDAPDVEERPVLLFLAAGTRRSNIFRAGLLDQFPIHLTQSYKAVKEEYENKNESFPEQIMLITSECSTEHRTTTIPWMRQSKFCLQPPGDSPTRKSIYDSILSGCIPMLFTNQYQVEYPFEKFLNYSDFTYTIDDHIMTNDRKSVFQIVSEIPVETMISLHKNLRKVAKWFQYSLSNADINNSDDAFSLILHEIAMKHNIY